MRDDFSEEDRSFVDPWIDSSDERHSIVCLGNVEDILAKFQTCESFDVESEDSSSQANPDA